MNSVENKYVKIPRKTPFITILLVDGIVERLKITWQTQYIRTKLLSKILLINLVWWNKINRIKCKGNYYGHTLISFKISFLKVNKKNAKVIVMGLPKIGLIIVLREKVCFDRKNENAFQKKYSNIFVIIRSWYES